MQVSFFCGRVCVDCYNGIGGSEIDNINNIIAFICLINIYSCYIFVKTK